MMTPAQVGIAGEVKPYQMMRPTPCSYPSKGRNCLSL